MAVNAKTVKKRIKSVKNTQKMTRAMEMVSAAKMRKAIAATQRTRLYATLARDLMSRMESLDDPSYALLQERAKVGNILVILISSNRGLCGSYNANLFKQIHATISNKDEAGAALQPKNIHVLGIGKKGAIFAKRHGYDLISVYEDFSESPDFDDIVPIARESIEEFTKGTYDRVFVAYTHFKSPVQQEVRMRQILPISEKDLTELQMVEHAEEDLIDMNGYLLEPDMDAIVQYVLPKLVEIQLYQAVTDAAASEHSARMMAMKNASENASEMVKSLTLAYNKARQAAITQEISEIVGGAAALE